MKCLFLVACVGLSQLLLLDGVEGSTHVIGDSNPKESKIIVNWCSVCVALVEWLDAHIVNDTENGLDVLFGKTCSLLPEKYRAECQSLADQLVPVLTKLLLEEYIPIKLCRLLTVCSGTEIDNTGIAHIGETPKTLSQYKPETFTDKQVGEICSSLPFKYTALCHEIFKTKVLQEVTSQSKEPRG